MGDVSEIQEAKKWIYDSLHNNADIATLVGTRIYMDYAPQTPASRVYPYILYNLMGGTDSDGLGTVRVLTLPLFQVRVVTDGRPDGNARKIDKRIDDVLQNAVYQPSGDYFFTARREQPIDRPEFDTATNKQYHNLGGLYRLAIGRTT